VSLLVLTEYVSSPKKRKAQGAHQAAPIPSTAPQYHSPSFVHVSSNYSTPGRRTHTRQTSDSSTRGGHDTHNRPTRSRGYTESSQPETEEQRRQRQQYPVGGGAEDRSDSGSQSSYQTSSKRNINLAESGPASPKGGPVTATSRKSSFGANEAAV
jgi:hypothetical protein